ncbi:hypothetical protein Tco_0880425 [Tanacetum coccineum]
MLAPSGEGLILYQAYGNLYALTGRKAHVLEDKKIPSVGVFDEVFSTWMAFGGNTRDLGSFGEETDKITDLHQIHEEVLFTERGDGVTGIKRRSRDLSSDGVRDLATVSGRTGYSLKDKKQSQNDKTEHENRKSMMKSQSQSQSQPRKSTVNAEAVTVETRRWVAVIDMLRGKGKLKGQDEGFELSHKKNTTNTTLAAYIKEKTEIEESN